MGNNTRLPKTIERIMKDHRASILKIARWLKSLGCETSCGYGWLYDEDSITRLTHMEIETNHANDYVECGPGYDDPLGEMFYVVTKIGVDVIINSADLEKITKELERFAFPDKYDRDYFNEEESKYIKPKGMDHINLHFFSYERKVEVVDFNPNKLMYKLKFDIHHKWH